MNWIFRWDFVISSGTFYASANYDYDPDLKCSRKNAIIILDHENCLLLGLAGFQQLFVVNFPCEISDKFYGGYL